MEHTYFFKTLHWSAQGTYYGEDGEPHPLSGEVDVVRSAEEWTLRGFLEVLLPEPVRFTNDYRIAPADRPLALAWESVNPALGVLRGTLEVVGGSLVSVYRSEDGVYAGTETLVQLGADAYYNVGVSFRGGRRLSSWTARLTAGA